MIPKNLLRLLFAFCFVDFVFQVEEVDLVGILAVQELPIAESVRYSYLLFYQLWLRIIR